MPIRRQRMEAVPRHGSQWWRNASIILTMLKAKRNSSYDELAASIKRRKSVAHGYVQDLEQMGLVSTGGFKTGRTIRLTQAGKDAVRHIHVRK